MKIKVKPKKEKEVKKMMMDEITGDNLFSHYDFRTGRTKKILISWMLIGQIKNKQPIEADSLEMIKLVLDIAEKYPLLEESEITPPSNFFIKREEPYIFLGSDMAEIKKRLSYYKEYYLEKEELVTSLDIDIFS